jgi:2,5-furandicarboxylate decarboxylase 1
VKDLRAFLARLAEDAPESIVHVRRSVSPDRELAAVVKRLERRGNPVVVFHDVEGSDLPVICGVHATRERVATALELDADDVVEGFLALSPKAIPPAWVETGPVKDVVTTGADVDLGTLPIVAHAAGDAGKYVGAGVGLARGPDGEAVNAGIYRLMLVDSQTLTCHVNRFHHLAEIIRRAEEAQTTVELAVVVGHHPAVQLGSQMKNTIASDSLALMGGLLREPLAVTRAETIDVPVPAAAELVLECEIRPGEHAPDGPYGEFTYYYGSDQAANVVHVKAITRRRDALFMDLHNVHSEHRNLWICPMREANLLAKLREILPRTRRVHIPDSGAGLHAYVSIDKLREGDGKNAIITALAADHILKHVVVVDADVDPLDEAEVLWAVATRFQGDRDLLVLPGSHCTSLDPSSYSLTDRHRSTGMTTKMGFDATMPVEVSFAKRADTLEGEHRDLEPSQYIDAGDPAATAAWLRSLGY